MLVASKGRFDRARTPTQRRVDGRPAEATQGTDEFMDATLDVWDLPAEQAGRVGHPAPFPSSSPTADRALHLRRRRRARPLRGQRDHGRRRCAHRAPLPRLRHRSGLHRHRRGSPRGRAGPAHPLGRTDSAVDVTGRLLTQAGFTDLSRRYKLPGIGIEVTWSALAPQGRVWLFDVVGGFTVAPTGLSRPDVTWRAVGRAAAARTAYPNLPLVLVTPDPARPRSPAAGALAGWVGSRKPVRAVLDLSHPQQTLSDLRRLTRR